MQYSYRSRRGFFDFTIPENADKDDVEIKAKIKAAASQKSGAERKKRLQDFCNNNNWIEVFSQTTHLKLTSSNQVTNFI
jgi:hypothetical protein